MNRAVQLNPNFAEVYYYGRGKDYLARKDYAQASTSFQAAIKAKPDFAEAYSGVGEIYFSQGKYFSASQNFSQAIALKPELSNRLNSKLAEASDYSTVELKNLADYKLRVTLSPVDNFSTEREFSINPRDSLTVQNLKPGSYQFRFEFFGSSASSYNSDNSWNKKREIHLTKGYNGKVGFCILPEGQQDCPKFD